MNSEERSNEETLDDTPAEYVIRNLAARLAAAERERDAAMVEAAARATFVNGAAVAQVRIAAERDAALAASPTPTGPEPAKCEHKRTEEHWGAEPSFFVGYCPGPATPTGTEPLRVYRERPRGAAATPEPTEETPKQPKLGPIAAWLAGPGGADPKETRP